MSFSREWDKIYSKKKGSIWPWSDLVSYYSKVSNKLPSNPNILELGFGTGANIPFFISNNINYYGVEGSNNAHSIASEHFPIIKKNLFLGDFTKNLPFKNLKFDLVFDRASISHNNYISIINTVKNIFKLLNTDGFFIGIDWFSDEHSEFKKGEFIDDEKTKIFGSELYFGNYGKVHFVNENSIRNYFDKNFEFLFFEKKIKVDLFSNKKKVFYDFIVKKMSENDKISRK